MNVVLIIPTGIGAKIGGNCGDGASSARLLGETCDNLLIHPNVVNASDINSQPHNSLYCEGSILDRFLEGKILLEKVNSNKILVAVNKEVDYQSLNAVSAARCCLGVDAQIIELDISLELIATMKKWHGEMIASGEVRGWEKLVDQVKEYEFDALVIATPITVSKKIMSDYFEGIGSRVNPVGAVESIASKYISNALNKQVAHGPISYTIEGLNRELDPTKAVEGITENFIHCCLKGLHKAPRIVFEPSSKTLSNKDIDVMVSPYGCWGPPHRSCMDNNIPIIVVKENQTVLNDDYPEWDKIIFVENYIEAAGMIMCMRSGVHPSTVRRPISYTSVVNKD